MEGVEKTLNSSMIKNYSVYRDSCNADETTLIECQFADDGALLFVMRSGAERAAGVVSRGFGLTVSIPAQKLIRY